MVGSGDEPGRSQPKGIHSFDRLSPAAVGRCRINVPRLPSSLVRGSWSDTALHNWPPCGAAFPVMGQIVRRGRNPRRRGGGMGWVPDAATRARATTAAALGIVSPSAVPLRDSRVSLDGRRGVLPAHVVRALGGRMRRRAADHARDERMLAETVATLGTETAEVRDESGPDVAKLRSPGKVLVQDLEGADDAQKQAPTALSRMGLVPPLDDNYQLRSCRGRASRVGVGCQRHKTREWAGNTQRILLLR